MELRVSCNSQWQSAGFFAELMEGVAAMQAEREGKATLRSYKVKPIRSAARQGPDQPEDP
jgi:hypothetical protein